MQNRLCSGASLEIEFDAFVARLEIRSCNQVHLEIVGGDNEGFVDDFLYELHWVRDDVAVLSFQEHIGTTVTHVIDFAASRAYTTVAPASGGFLRLMGRVQFSSQPPST